MTTVSRLLGPPALSRDGENNETLTPFNAAEIRRPDDLIALLSKSTLNDETGDDSDESDYDSNFPPLMGLTENLSPTLLSTGNPCLDFFFHAVPDTPAKDLIGRLELAWAHDPLLTLKLVCNLRGVRGTGKSDKKGFYTAAFWLYCFHPKTLAENVKAISDFGYFKDFPEILYRIIQGPEIREIETKERQERIHSSRRIPKRRRSSKEEGEEGEEKKVKVRKSPEEIQKMLVEEKEKARVLRKEKEAMKAKRALDVYNLDENYRLLYDSIAELFAELLRTDSVNLKEGKISDITLAAKWCPSVDSSYDKATLLCESIARRLFPKDAEYDAIDERHYVYRVRNRLRKEILVPLHRALELPEVYMSSNEWNSLPYKRVASVAMKTYKELFKKHDEERFDKYLEDVKSGKAKIAAGALLPHEIIKSLEDDDGGEVAELQWKRMVADMVEKGQLSNCIAVCDVSGSMSGIPMEVSVALGVLVSELSEEPWKGKLITFSEDPQLQKVEGETLKEKTDFVRIMDWGMSTNFQGVFDRILEVAIEGKLKEEQVVKRVFVFSDMEFNQASQNPWETDLQAIQRKFREKGYQSVPEIVFWNLRDSRSTPVAANQSGVGLVSGFSKNLLTMFLNGGGIVDPVAVMEAAIAGEEYAKLAVLD